MKSDELRKIASRIKKYDLIDAFESVPEFDDWLSKLNTRQIKNLNSLILDPSTITFPKVLLINENLLECDDYNNRINAMLKLKVVDEYHFRNLCSKNFLNSKNYYKDMEMLSKVNSDKHYILSIIDEKSFIESKYHDQDLKLLVDACNIENDDKNKNLSMVVSALARIAKNSASIKSKYHEQDMELIASFLYSDCSYPGDYLTDLATNEVSLNDKYHLENMRILSEEPISEKYLYYIMVNSRMIKGNNYRKEIEALNNAKSKIKAQAIYYYIYNPKDVYYFDFSQELYACGVEYNDIHLLETQNNLKGSLNPKYLEYLNLLNQVEDKYVMFIENLLANKASFYSGYQEYDLNLLLTITDKDMFMDLYRVMTDKYSLEGQHHINDVNMISKATNEEIRKLLWRKAIEEESINSDNHEYDMFYITRLDLDNIEQERFNKMKYYLFNSEGINHAEHIDRLEKLYRGELLKNDDVILEHLNNIEKNPDVSIINKDSKSKVLSKFKRLFRK